MTSCKGCEREGCRRWMPQGAKDAPGPPQATPENAYSIRENGVYTGLWTDHSNGNRVVTLDVRSAGYLISATTLFVALVGSCVWSMVKFIVHQRLASVSRTDGPGLFFRVLYRNAGAEIGTIWELGNICWAWRKSTPRAQGIEIRALTLMLPAVTNVLVFAAAGILSSKIAGRSYESNHILLKASNYGIIVWDSNLTWVEAQQMLRVQTELMLNNTQAARLYAHNCYHFPSDSVQCSLFPTRSIPYEADTVNCPFGQDPVGRSLCQPDGNRAFRLTTPLLDANIMFGINVPKEKSIAVRKSLTCSPIQISSYLRTDHPDLDNATTFLELGPIRGMSDYVASHQTQSKKMRIGYQIYSALSGQGGDWIPIDPLQVSHGDVSVNVLAGNSIVYYEPVNDPWFAATTHNEITALETAYQTDNDLSVLACIDQSQICNPNSNSDSRCTILGGMDVLHAAYENIGLNGYQKNIADRFASVMSLYSTWTAVNLQGAGALLAPKQVMALTSPGLPDNQWQLEVRDWFETALAATQAAIAQYVNMDQTVLGKHATVSTLDIGIPEKFFCDKQRVRNTGSYISFSFLGLMILYGAGAALILTSWMLEPMLSWFRSAPTERGIVHLADQKFQVLRKSLVSAEHGNHEWDCKLNDIPVTGGDRYFSLPMLQDLGGDKDFLPTRPALVEALQEAKIDTNRNMNRIAVQKDNRYLYVQVDEQQDGDSFVDHPQPVHVDHPPQTSSSSHSELSAITDPREQWAYDT